MEQNGTSENLPQIELLQNVPFAEDPTKFDKSSSLTDENFKFVGQENIKIQHSKLVPNATKCYRL
jgi:hypothetical protein